LLTTAFVDDVPPPRSQKYVSGSRSLSLEALPSNVTVRGGVPDERDLLITAVGAVLEAALPCRVNNTLKASP
jgi:hypothetical protein